MYYLHVGTKLSLLLILHHKLCHINYVNLMISALVKDKNG